MTTPGKVRIGTGENEIIVTVNWETGNKKHIIITASQDMEWSAIWKAMRKLPRHLQNNRNRLKKQKQTRKKK